jgi:hypothetical protein
MDEEEEEGRGGGEERVKGWRRMEQLRKDWRRGSFNRTGGAREGMNG